MAAFRMPSGAVVILTDGECLLIARRRRGESQAEAARRHGVSYQIYSAWELGLETPPPAEVGELKTHERSYILRRREGRRQRDVARDMGVCPYTLRKMERGLVDAGPLMDYWNRLGETA